MAPSKSFYSAGAVSRSRDSLPSAQLDFKTPFSRKAPPTPRLAHITRYLTPSKVCLLALIHLYIEGGVPDVARITVLEFIMSHITDYDMTKDGANLEHRWRKAKRTIHLVSSIDGFAQVLFPHPSAYGMKYGIEGRLLWDDFLQKLWNISSLDDLHDLLAGHHYLPQKKRKGKPKNEWTPPFLFPKAFLMSPNSPFGAFARKLEFECTRMRFPEVSKLWKDFIKYRHQAARYWCIAQRYYNQLSFCRILMEGSHEWGKRAVKIAEVAYPDISTGHPYRFPPVTHDTIEFLLEFQVEKMQKFGCRVPVWLRKIFNRLLRHSKIQPNQDFYLKFLEAWRRGEHNSSFHYLHRYYDFKLHSRDRLLYQYALLNRAILECDFGARKEALATMIEAASAAKENRDTPCLNYTLMWLFHFGKANPQLVKKLYRTSALTGVLNSTHRILAYLRIRSRQVRNPAMWSSALLSEAKSDLAGGRRTKWAIGNMVRGSGVLVRHNVRRMLCVRQSMYAATWERLGATVVAHHHCHAFLRLFTPWASFDDELAITCRYARHLALRGSYDDAFSVLDGIDRYQLRSWRPKALWHKYRALLRARQLLHHGDLDGAEAVLAQLLQLCPHDMEPDLLLVAESLRVELLARRGDLAAALAAVERLQADTRRRRDVSPRISLLLLKADLLARAGRPARGFTISLRAAKLARRSRVMPALWQAAGAMAGVLVSTGAFVAAGRLLEAVIPRALACDIPYVAAQLLTLLGDARVGMAGRLDAGSRWRAEALRGAREAFRRALRLFGLVEDVERKRETSDKIKAVVHALEREKAALESGPKAALIGLYEIGDWWWEEEPADGGYIRHGQVDRTGRAHRCDGSDHPVAVGEALGLEEDYVLPDGGPGVVEDSSVRTGEMSVIDGWDAPPSPAASDAGSEADAEVDPFTPSTEESGGCLDHNSSNHEANGVANRYASDGDEDSVTVDGEVIVVRDHTTPNGDASGVEDIFTPNRLVAFRGA